MGEISNAFNSFSSAVYGVSNTVDKHMQTQAQLDLNAMQVELKKQAELEMQSLANNGNWDEWGQQIDDFFTKVSDRLSDKNDKTFYCRNNLTSRMATQMLDSARSEYQVKVAAMQQKEQKKENIVKLNTSLQGVVDMYGGQEAVDQARVIIDNAFNNGDIDITQRESLTDWTLQKATDKSYSDALDLIADKAIENGWSEDDVYSYIKKNDTGLVRYDRDGVMSNGTPRGEYMDNVEKNVKTAYKIKRQKVQEDNQNWFDDDINGIYSDIVKLTAGEDINIASLNKRITIGTSKNERTAEASLPEGQRKKNTSDYASFAKMLQSYLDEKAQGKSGSAAIYKDDDVNRQIKYTVQSWKRGDKSEYGGPANAHDAYSRLKIEITQDIYNITGEALNWQQIEEKYPVIMTFFDEIDKAMPETAKAGINTVKNVITTAVTNKYGEGNAENVIAECMDLFKDTLYELSNSDMDSIETQKVIDRFIVNANSLYGLELEKSKYWKQNKLSELSTKTDTLRDYKEGMRSQEKRMATAMEERDNNKDLVFKDKNGNYKRTGDDAVQTGLIRLEKDERETLKETLLKQYGLEITDGDIGSDWETDGNYDVTARKIYHVNNKDYRFHAENGKVVLEESDSGETNWHTIRTAKQQEEYDTPASVAKRAKGEQKDRERDLKAQVQDILANKEISSVPDVDYYELMDNNGERIKLNFRTFNKLSESKKRKVIFDLLNKYPEETAAWLEQLADKKK